MPVQRAHENAAHSTQPPEKVPAKAATKAALMVVLTRVHQLWQEILPERFARRHVQSARIPHHLMQRRQRRTAQ
jgi:hypothetical protein